MLKPAYKTLFSGHLLASLHLRLLQSRWRLGKHLPSSLLQKQVIDRPIFLLGTQGGGLTFLGRVLRRSKGVFSMASDRHYWNSRDEMHIHMDTSLPEGLRLRHSSALRELGVSEVFNYAGDKFIDHFRYVPADATNLDAESFQKTLKGLQYLIARKKTKPRFIDKSQSFTIKVGYLDTLLAGCDPMFLLVSRNPLAICAREAAKVRAFDSSEAAFNRRLEECASHWNNSFKLAFEDAEKYDLLDRFKAVQIEQVLAQPEAKVREICDFLGLEYCDAMLPKENDSWKFPHTKDKKWFPIRQAANKKYTKDLSEHQIQLVIGICGKMMEKMGYEL